MNETITLAKQQLEHLQRSRHRCNKVLAQPLLLNVAFLSSYAQSPDLVGTDREGNLCVHDLASAQVLAIPVAPTSHDREVWTQACDFAWVTMHNHCAYRPASVVTTGP